MDFGIALAPGVDAWKIAERAERLGFTHAWFYDTQMLCADVFVAMALAAAHSAKIVLGTGVLVPSNPSPRSPPTRSRRSTVWPRGGSCSG